jgi:transcriptional regulator with XRE-family HTH domain
MESGQAWIELGRAVEARRRELGLTLVEASARTRDGERKGFSDQTWASIEKGERERRQGTLADLSWALGWTEDSAERILAGEAPRTRFEPAPPSRFDALLDELTTDAAERRLFRAMFDFVEERRGSPDH